MYFPFRTIPKLFLVVKILDEDGTYRKSTESYFKHSISQKGTDVNLVTISINSSKNFEIVISAEFIPYEDTYILLWKTSLMFTLMKPKTANISKAKKSEEFLLSDH